MSSGASVLVIGVDGLDYDVVVKLGRDLLPNLYPLVIGSNPHAATFPPDSVPSWMSILTGLAPEEHGQLHSVNFFLETGQNHSGEEALHHLKDHCFWEKAPGALVGVINPFLAYPPWPPNGKGAMVSGPSFSESAPLIADPNSLLTGEPPRRMGGFARLPKQSELEEFAAETLQIGAEQFDYSLRQLNERRWDIFFHTNLTVDRIQHFAWRHFDPSDPTHPGDALAHLVPAAYEQLDRFIGAAQAMCRIGDATIVFSDHGHGQRASVGVNFNEIFRREGVLLLDKEALWRRAVETAKTGTLWMSANCHLEDQAIWLAKRMPGKAALKSGEVAGLPRKGSASVPNVGGSNPFGGIRLEDDRLIEPVQSILRELRYRGQDVVKWCVPAEDILPTGKDPGGVYPALLFELHPIFGPTWNMYGPCFMPIITHGRLSGGHTRRAVITGQPALPLEAMSSMAVHRVLANACLAI